MAPTLEQYFTFRLYRSAPDTLVLGTSASGTRIITPYSSGYLRTTSSSSSASINATLTTGSSNNLTLDASGTTHLDARVHFRDNTLNAAFSVHFTGVARPDALIQKILDGSPEARTTESKEHYEFCLPVFEVSRDEDRWMESTCWVGHGHYVVEPGKEAAVEFEVYRLVSG